MQKREYGVYFKLDRDEKQMFEYLRGEYNINISSLFRKALKTEYDKAVQTGEVDKDCILKNRKPFDLTKADS